jgi:hypothetical protein
MQDLLADVTLFGMAWQKGGKRIDPRDVYAVPTEQMQQYKLHDSRPNSIIFHCAVNDEQTAVLRISKDGIWANPDVPCDEAAKKVLEALDGYVKSMVARAVSEQAAEIERLGNLCYDYIGQLTALRAAKQMQQRIDELKGVVRDWVPVAERLPKPGKFVLAVFRYSTGKQVVIRAMHAPPKTLSEEDYGEFLTDPDYDEATDTTYWPEGWYECNENEETHWQVHEEVTHWMPLPEVPHA